MSMLTEELKKEIQTAYSAWLAARGFRARRGQREMIAAIARTLTGESPRLAAIEAGTGTGKTAAYCLAAIPVAKALGKTVIISSATVALQEQVVMRDLPDLQEHAGLEFDFALAKGRGRYLCLKRLDERLRYQDQQEIPLFEADSTDHTVTYQEMLRTFANGQWNGELDSWSVGAAASRGAAADAFDSAWRAVTTDHRGCTNNRCSFFRQCPFFKARNQLDGVEVIVANHDLMLADLNLGGGVVLPEPEDAIFIIDEAHHLPDKTQQHFAVNTRIRGTLAWVDHVDTVVSSLTQRFGRPQELTDIATKLGGHCDGLKQAFEVLAATLSTLQFNARDAELETHRFVLGRVEQNLADAALAASVPVTQIADAVERVHELLRKAVDGESDWAQAFEAEDWLPAVGQLETRAQATAQLLNDFAAAGGDGSDRARHARWVNRTEQDLELVSAPIEPGLLLRDNLWSRCFAAITTSATLAALGRFDRFLERAGLDDVAGVRIPSPFDFPNIAVLAVPDMRSDPRDFETHTAEVAELLPELLAQERSALVLFTSWRQMLGVCRQLPERLSGELHIQGERSKQALLKAHRKRIDAGEASYLMGLASFAEGVDLPDDYCRHVVIVKLPFAVPDDPIDQAIAEWAESRGKNAFYEISVPDTALKLVQACGRLIRHEDDHGRITVLDKRIVTQAYGRVLLESLPPYRLDLRAS
ncbi:MAG: ATP-dependent DNA helicase DinG [Gammaproteobacteria bacterium]|nr:ATP-dependent DNA helicase DinG [Gammaproteobacteria bacterium]